MKKSFMIATLMLVLLVPAFLPVSAIQSVDKLSTAPSGEIFFAAPYRADFKHLMNGGTPPQRVALHGVLTLPVIKGGKVPAVVLLHTSLGIRPHLADSAKALNKAGMAAFVVDSHTTRGGKFSVAAARDMISTRIADAYAALNLLATHPLIDPERIAVMGYSGGAAAALMAASGQIGNTLNGGQRRFAAHVGVYPYCWRYLDKPRATGAPVLMLLGELDNVDPASQCVDFGKRIEASGSPVRTIIYPGTYHAFDFPNLIDKVVHIARFKDMSQCADRVLLARNDGTWRAPHLGKTGATPAAFGDLTADCAKGKAGFGSPKGTAKKAMQDMLGFLKDVFGLAKS